MNIYTLVPVNPLSSLYLFSKSTYLYKILQEHFMVLFYQSVIKKEKPGILRQR